MTKYHGHAVFSDNCALPDAERIKKSMKKGAHSGRVAFRIEGIVYSLNECLTRTGMDEKSFRALHRKLKMRKAFSWKDFPQA